jgi:hypothetical protein
MSLDFILRSEDIEEEHIYLIGRMKPNQYFLMLNQNILASGLSVEPDCKDQPLIKLIKQKAKVIVGSRTMLVSLICQPYPTEKKNKPSGMILEDLSFIQIKEILLFDVVSSELFCYEYSYHYGIWDFHNNKELYQLRYDREVILKNPPRKNIEHFHVVYNDPHFDSEFMKLTDVLRFILINWDQTNNRFHIKEFSS